MMLLICFTASWSLRWTKFKSHGFAVYKESFCDDFKVQKLDLNFTKVPEPNMLLSENILEKQSRLIFQTLRSSKPLFAKDCSNSQNLYYRVLLTKFCWLRFVIPSSNTFISYRLAVLWSVDLHKASAAKWKWREGAAYTQSSQSITFFCFVHTAQLRNSRDGYLPIFIKVLNRSIASPWFF